MDKPGDFWSGCIVEVEELQRYVMERQSRTVSPAAAFALGAVYYGLHNLHCDFQQRLGGEHGTRPGAAAPRT